jgi:hypothetical protein
MKKWWIGAAVAAVCVAQSARAQSPPGAAVLPDPVPEAQCAPPNQGGLNFIPGPMGGPDAPPGPGNGLSLPADVPTAWGRGPMPESAGYLSLGAMALMRQQPGRGAIAEVDQRSALTTHDIDPDYFWGVRATFGYLFDDSAIELTGFYLPQEQTTALVGTLPGGFTLPFTNSPPSLLGPTGVGLLSRADAVSESLQTTMADAELNYRWWSRSTTEWEGILGFRYMNVQERANVTASSVVTGLTSGMVDTGSLVGVYMARANNNLLLAQTGFEWELPVKSWLTVGLIAKGSIGADYANITTRLGDGAGNVSSTARRDDWGFSSADEFTAYIDVVQFDKIRLRVGYTAMWLLGVAEGFQQLNFNLSSAPATHNGGSIFYHGPMLELELLF